MVDIYIIQKPLSVFFLKQMYPGNLVNADVYNIVPIRIRSLTWILYLNIVQGQSLLADSRKQST